MSIVQEKRLHAPAHYFPFFSGKYEIRPGLSSLTTDFGNGKLDKYIFQIDAQYYEYLAQKELACAENIEKYFTTYRLTTATAQHIIGFIINRLITDYPLYFTIKKQAQVQQLYNNLTDTTINVDENEADISILIEMLKNLGKFVQEDIAVLQLSGDNRQYLSLLHLCFPNYWSAQEKIGKDFISIHTPVPGMDRINRQTQNILTALLTKGPYVRFAWGLTTDKQLNHHPIPPNSYSASTWHGRLFDLTSPQLFVRTERQTIVGFPEQNSILFTIRTYFEDVNIIKKNLVMTQKLLRAIESMGDESLAYKGLTHSRNDIIKWLTDN